MIALFFMLSSFSLASEKNNVGTTLDKALCFIQKKRYTDVPTSHVCWGLYGLSISSTDLYAEEHFFARNKEIQQAVKRVSKQKSLTFGTSKSTPITKKEKSLFRDWVLVAQYYK